MNPYATRKYIIGAIIVIVFLLFFIRLFYIQIIDNSYKYSAENNSHRYVTQYPARGLILDRKGKVLVCNQAAYDLMTNPSELKAFDTAEFCGILHITKEQVSETIKKIKQYSKYKSSLFLSQISGETYAILQEKLYKYPGFFVQARTLRKYDNHMAPHLLGYIGEVDSNNIKKDPYYQIGDYIGINGIEKSYEKELRGKKGVSIFLVDVHNRIKGSFKNGEYDTAAIVGKNLITSIDAELQAYGEKLMKGFRGSVVAIEPSTGEVLALISSPAYDPELLVGRERSSNYASLMTDPLKPLFNRALMAKYPPGSTFKLIQALIAQQEDLINTFTTFPCYQGFTLGSTHAACHLHRSPLNLPQSIQNSCNAYYCNVFKKILENPKYSNTEAAFQSWRKMVMTFGLGQKLKSDFPEELQGYVPTSEFYNKIYGRNHWKFQTIYSLAFGQGELGVTPLQMANLACIIANKGYYCTPHIVKQIEGEPRIDSIYLIKHYSSIKLEYFEEVIYGMDMAVNDAAGGGTATTARLDSIVVCGKTGTAQNPPRPDHSIFMAFAPKENPKIAISVYIENGGFGANWAAPLAGLMIEKYLKGTIKNKWSEERILNANMLNAGQ